MISAAIVGLGWWGKTLVESVADGSDDIRFVAGATRTKTPQVEDFAKAQGFELRQSYDDLLTDDGIDAVVLATPHSMHTDQIVSASAAGKHVFCEKPFALSKADAEAAVAATQNAGVTLGLGYNRRLHPEMNKLRDQINSGDLGTILAVQVQGAAMQLHQGLRQGQSQTRTFVISVEIAIDLLEWRQSLGNILKRDRYS